MTPLQTENSHRSRPRPRDQLQFDPGSLSSLWTCLRGTGLHGRLNLPPLDWNLTMTHCICSCNLGPPLTSHSLPMTWTRAWTLSRPTLLTPLGSCGTAWWPVTHPHCSLTQKFLILELIVAPEICSLTSNSNIFSLPQVNQAGIRMQSIFPFLCPFLSVAPKTKV